MSQGRAIEIFQPSAQNDLGLHPVATNKVVFTNPASKLLTQGVQYAQLQPSVPSYGPSSYLFHSMLPSTPDGTLPVPAAALRMGT